MPQAKPAVIAVTPNPALDVTITVDELVEIYRSLSGEHRDWDEYRRTMVADRRVVVRVVPDRAYGLGR